MYNPVYMYIVHIIHTIYINTYNECNSLKQNLHLSYFELELANFSDMCVLVAEAIKEYAKVSHAFLTCLN